MFNNITKGIVSSLILTAGMYSMMFTISSGTALANNRTCSSQPIPSGWVVTDVFNSFECGQFSSSGNTRIVTQPTRNLTICNVSLPPSEWVITARFYAMQCKGNTSSFDKNAYTIDLPSNGLTVCNISLPPKGWVAKERFYAIPCEGNVPSLDNNAYTIRLSK
jgi:hypothetical protein